MDPNEMFESTKREMIKMIENCNLSKMVEQKEIFQAYLNFFESMHRLSIMRENINPDLILSNQPNIEESTSEFVVETKNINEIRSGISETELEMPVERAATDVTGLTVGVTEETGFEERKMYLFERKLRGGFIQELSAVVPEGIVRKMGFEHHDYIYATEIPSTEGHTKKKYHYELAKKAANVVPHDRIQINYCPIEKDGSLFVVRKSLETGQDIRIHDAPQSLLISDEDIREFCLKEGDIVDIAYAKGKAELTKVVYLHHTESDEITSSAKTSPSSPPKKVTKEIQVVDSEPIPQTLLNKKILVVGNEPDRMHYKEGIEARGGIFLWSDAKDSLITLQANVRKSDIVIFLLSVSGHTGMKQIKRSCKANNIPFLTKFGNGTTSMIRMAEEAVLDKAIQV